MRILITGASGFIGRRLVARLLARGHDVSCVGRRPAAFLPGVTQIEGDFSRDHQLQDWLPRLEGIDAVVNAVGIIREREGQTFEALHVKAPTALFAACAEMRLRRVVQISALGADDMAKSRFHLSKRAADTDLLSRGLSAVVVQPSLVYGTGGGSAELFDRLACLPLTPLPAGGLQQVQPIHVDDLADALVALVESSEVCGRVALVGPTPMSLRELLAQLRASMRLPPLRPLPVPAMLMDCAAMIGDRMPRLLLDRENWQMLQRENTASVEATAALLGRLPRPASQFIPSEQAAGLRWQATSDWLMYLLRLTVAAMWIFTALLSLGLYPTERSLELLARAGLNGAIANVALYGAALLDLALGIATLCCRGLWLWRLQVALILGYTAIISWKLPEFWLHPFGPILKNLPLLAALWLLHERDRR